MASQYLLILHYVITETHATLILENSAGQMATSVSIFVTVIIFTVELPSLAQEEPLYSGEKRILLKTINNKNIHGINHVLIVLQPRLNTDTGCRIGK